MTPTDAPPSLSDIATALRFAMLHEGDMERAIEVANDLADECCDKFNEADTTVQTSLLARAGLVRAMIEVAAHWMAETTDAPLPECYAAFRSLVDDPPPGLEGHIIFRPIDEEE